MFYLALSVLCSVLLGFILKLFPRFGVDSFQAIVFNYFTCVTCATLQLGHCPVLPPQTGAAWFPWALMLGFVFIGGFTGAALTVRHFGVMVAQIMQKMSILLSVPFAILAYGEKGGWLKIVGFLLALAAIVLVNLPGEGKRDAPQPARNWVFWAIPFFTWLLSGVIEVVFIRLQNERMLAFGDVAFISTVFGTAGCLGMAYAAWGWFSGNMKFSWRNVAGGIVLGIPNYGSMVFILLGIGSGLEGSFFFPVSNVGIILATALGAVFLFGEKLTRANWGGIALALAAICLISV